MEENNLSKWFLESQQALGIAGPICSRANDMISTCRSQIENATVVWAQISFMKTAIGDQFELLQEIKASLKGLQMEFSTQFQTVLTELDVTGAVLNRALEALEKTELDDGLKGGATMTASTNANDRNTSGNGSHGSHEGSGSLDDRHSTRTLVHKSSGEGKDFKVTLRSFVHEDGLQQLRRAISDTIDRAQECGNEINRHVANLDVSIADLNKRMLAVMVMKRQSIERANESANSIADNAHSMAGLLESLTRHYDLSLQGVEMANSADKDLDQLYQVLEHDSELVEGVIEDLYGKQKVIEECEKEVSNFSSQMDQAHEAVTSFFESFEDFGTTKLTVYSESLDRIAKDQRTYIDEIQQLKKELESLSEYYTLFLSSYHAMILEILRRKKSQTKIEAVIRDMKSALHKAHEEEVQARQKFISERGDYLPSNLWDGLAELPSLPEVKFTRPDLPNVDEQSVNQAVKHIQI
jgi:autophagy-related protein 17